jgi:probable rRNA maturation factor
MLEVATEVTAGDWDAAFAPEELAEAAVRAALEGAGHAEALARPGLDLEVSVLFADDDEVRRLNRDFRGKDRPTNILSFPMLGARDAARLLREGEGSHLLGDLALAFETVVREAQSEGKPVSRHVSHLLVHGTLHLLGHTHEGEAEAEAMERLEVAILERLGLPDPYAARDPAHG